MREIVKSGDVFDEAAFRERVFEGSVVAFSVHSPIESRTLSAQWIRNLVASEERLRVPLEIEGAVIDGDLDLEHCVFERRVKMIDCVFRGRLKVNHSEFGGAVSLDRSSFPALSFESARFKSDLFLRRMSVTGPMTMARATILGELNLNGSAFEEGARFDRLRVSGKFEARPENGKVVRFGKEVWCRDAKLMDAVDFTGAQFGAMTSFNRSHFGGMTTFDSPAKDDASASTSFLGDVQFMATLFEGDVMFRGTYFGGRVSLDRAVVQGSAYFNPGRQDEITRFEGDASFKNLLCDGELSLRSTRFAARVVFYGAAVHAGMFFEPAQRTDGGPNVPTEFHGQAWFRCLRIQGEANFSKVEFRRTTPPEPVADGNREWSCSFNASRFEHVSFVGASFAGRTNFEGCRATEWINFTAARFSDELSFRESDFRVIFLRRELREAKGTISVDEENAKRKQGRAPRPEDIDDENAKRKQGKAPRPEGVDHTGLASVDFRGCTYLRIYVDPRYLVELFARRFSHQPYQQLEVVLRRSGLEREADDVCLVGRRAERNQSLVEKDYFRWIRLSLYGLIARYGIRPLRLVTIPCALLVCGAIAFMQPGALVSKSKGEQAGVSEPLPPASFLRAFGVSAGQLLPVELPVTSEIRASTEAISPDLGVLTFDGLATVLRLCGWILVPLGLGAVTGLLARKVKPSSESAE